MEKSEVKKFFDENAYKFKWFFGLTRWRLDIIYQDDSHPMSIKTDCRYLTAGIFVATDRFNNLDELISCFAHELLHCYTSYYEIYRHSVKRLVDKKTFKSIEESFIFAEETAICAMEYFVTKMMVDNPQKLLELIQTKWREANG